MANVPITDLTALGARPSTDDYFVVVDSSEALDADKTKKVAFQYMSPTFLTTPLSSTDWDGDSFSTTAKTLIDLSAVFGVPAGVKAIDVFIQAKDSGSESGNAFFALSPNDTSGSYPLACKLYGLPNDTYVHESGTVPCDANGDVYYQCFATGAGTLDVIIQIWGYFL